MAGVWIHTGSCYIMLRLYCSCTYIFVTKNDIFDRYVVQFLSMLGIRIRMLRLKIMCLWVS